jgi:uncharacterized membrane protein (DUF485 family)
VKALAQARWRIAIGLSLTVFALYFGFIFAVAFAKTTMAAMVMPGLSIGMLSGVLVMVGAWLTTWAYVRWANTHFDARRDAIHDATRS